MLVLTCSSEHWAVTRRRWRSDSVLSLNDEKRSRASVRDRWASCWDAALLLQSSESKHSGKSRLCPASHLPRGREGAAARAEGGGWVVRDDKRDIQLGSKPLKVAHSTLPRSIGLDVKKGVERALDWDTQSDWEKGAKGGEKQVQAKPGSPGKHGSSDGMGCRAQKMKHEKAKGMKQEAMTLHS